MALISMIVIGFIVGIVARFVKPGDDKMGFIMTTVLGIVGALLGGYLGRLIGVYRIGEPAGFIGAVLGSILLLFLIEISLGRRRRPI